MRITLGCDHAGFELKRVLLGLLKDAGHEVEDVGTYSCDAVDYPDYTRKVAEAVLSGRAERGLMICGSGVGASVAANKIPGIRAGLCHDTFSARQGVEDDDINVLCLGGRVVGSELACEIARAFLAARFSNAERHKRRRDKVTAWEKEYKERRP